VDIIHVLNINGADPNARRITGASFLYFASSYNHTCIVELLLNKYKAIIDLSTFDGSTSLHVACERGFNDIVQLLINSQGNINAKMNDGTTAIMLACQKGYDLLVNKLLKYKPNLELLKNGESVCEIFLYYLIKYLYYFLVFTCCNNV
jgi:ankyrin repeat protein